MADFPRTIKPAQVSPFRVSTGLVSPGVTGKDQLRAVVAMGREWDEIYSNLRVGTPDVDALMATLEDAYNQMTAFTIRHLMSPGSGRPRHGVGGGTPVVNGAGQTGSTLMTDGWTPSVANSVVKGDVFKIANVSPLFRVMETAASDASGNLALKLSPPIPAGMSPGDGAALDLETTLNAYITSLVLPPAIPGRLVDGIRVTWKELI